MSGLLISDSTKKGGLSPRAGMKKKVARAEFARRAHLSDEVLLKRGMSARQIRRLRKAVG
jgi:hypothetical protein